MIERLCQNRKVDDEKLAQIKADLSPKDLILSVSPTFNNFEKQSPKKEKKLSKSFIDLIIINTLIPIQFAYAVQQGKEISEQVIQMVSQLPSEKNAIIDKFKSFGVAAQNAFQSQALLQLKNEYCNSKKCLQCSIGIELIKN